MQKLQLSIPQPCHENWQNMTPTEKGRFCNACAKEVVDFSMMTDTEVMNYFTRITHQNVCGRVLPSQLERRISYPGEIKKRMYWYWNYIVMFFMFFGKANTIKAQDKIETPVALNAVERSQMPNGEVVVTTAGAIKRVSRQIINGKVTDEKNIPVPFASIMIKDSKTAVAADAKGLFSINADKNAVLLISAVGFKTTTMAVNNKTELAVVLNADLHNVILGGISFTGLNDTDNNIIKDDKDDTTKMKEVKQLNTVKREKVEVQKEVSFKLAEAINNLKVSPNPVLPGNSINLNMNLKETGLHQVQITDASYRTVFYKRINAVSRQQNEQIVCDSKWAAGIYFIKIYDTKNSLVNESSFIVQ